jgi:iron complex outermembrane recepter protein
MDLVSEGEPGMTHRWITLAALALAAPLAHAAAPPDSSAEDTLSRIVRLPEVVVSTTRLDPRAPIARAALGRAELVVRNIGLDTPMLLATLPGAYATSDAGNGIGYSYLAIRGFPQRRISVLVNGVPLNDPESHEVYWIDHPDLLASTAEAQVQRGVGSALYGGASVGGSVHLETAPFSTAPGFGATLAYGSFETKRLMLEGDSGPLAAGWNLYGRYSRIETAGYRDQSDSKLWSYALSARRVFEHQSFRVNLYGGPEETHLAYLGVPAAVLEGGLTGDADRDRRFNPITYAGERDHFFEPHYELLHSWSPSAGLTVSQTLFWFDGSGYYDERRTDRDLAEFRLSPWATFDSTLYARDHYEQDAGGALVRDSLGRVTVTRFDVVRRRTITNRHFGWVPRLRFEHARGALTLGGELRAHDGHHVGTVVSGDGAPPGTPPDAPYYDYHPRTLSAGLFAREEYQLATALALNADLAWRHQGYAMQDDRFDGVRFDQHYDFALPRLGLTWTPRPSLSVFGAWSTSSREPALRDLYDGETPGNSPLYHRVDPVAGTASGPLIKPEHVQDLELGLAWRAHDASITANLFRMDFRDELVYAGQFDTDLGYPILGNAARSVHQGLELAARAERAVRTARVTLDGNATLCDNHFVEYREVYGTSAGDTVRYDDKPIGFFPAVLGNLSARMALRAASASIEAQHAGRMYVDNTGSRNASIAPHTALAATVALRIPAGITHADVSLRVDNLLDARFATNGYMDYDSGGALVPQFIPAATRSLLAQVRWSF